MKQVIIFGQLLIASSIAFGQAPSFTANNCFQVNDSTKVSWQLLNETFESYLPQTGETHEWNLTAKNWTAPTTSYLFQPASASSHTTFSSSQINEYALTTFARDLFYSYSANNDTLYCDGMYLGTSYKARPSYPYLSFPLNFGDSVFTHTKQFAIPTQPNNATGSISRFWIYDGFGTLKLPYGISENVYRIRTKQIDSTYITSMAVTYEELIWFEQSSGLPVLRFMKNGNTINVYYALATNNTTGVKNHQKEQHPMIYPNPFNDVIYIDKHGDFAEVKMYDVTGKIVLQQGALNSMNTSLFPSGVYYIELITPTNETFRQKLMK